ncbi:hypothetical protein OV079_22220 [Nannocystis pusilla]|uniref:Uncharacterized protein n=1 Tax=Nannocystis pusilla TaxID=889268 RepID=A0A9X3EQL4_9BACT|nr:hypothetical protein [Nannocystis pusilla]MCY1008225.1 hypothetical protein [Nannocystis pusilla]
MDIGEPAPGAGARDEQQRGGSGEHERGHPRARARERRRRTAQLHGDVGVGEVARGDEEGREVGGVAIGV